jgi:predicted DNA-binding protein
MARMKENPRYNVVSMRISEEERRHLEHLMKTTNKNVSYIMREAIEYFSANLEHTRLHHTAVK